MPTDSRVSNLEPTTASFAGHVPRIGSPMIGRARWFGVVVSGATVLGAGSALVIAPSTGSAGVTSSQPGVAAVDPTTQQISSVVAQAQRLRTEIVNAQAQLAQLEHQVSIRANQQLVAARPALPRAVVPSRTGPSAATTPPTHTTTGASSTSATTENESD